MERCLCTMCDSDIDLEYDTETFEKYNLCSICFANIESILNDSGYEIVKKK